MYKPGNARIQKFYSSYVHHDVCFNQSINTQSGLLVNKNYLRCKGERFPCILYSASMAKARVLSYLSESNLKLIQEANKRIAIDLSFLNKETGKPLSFFIESKITGMSHYPTAKPNCYFISLDFFNRPPDDLIEILGSVIENEEDTERRLNERIVINNESQEKLQINIDQSFLFLDGGSKKCLISELSIFSAKVIVHGKQEEYANKNAMILIKSEGMKALGEMVGKITRCENIAAEEDLLSLIILFDQDLVPVSFKMWIGEYLEYLALQKHRIMQSET